jgi:electron transport complex protein RnfG
MYRSMVGVGLLCGLLIVLVFDLTKPVIERNKAEALRRAVFDVLPDARSSRTFLFDPDRGFVAVAEEDGASVAGAVHAGYAEGGRLVGIAIEAEGMGYQDVIRLLYGYSSERDAIIGVRVLESRETPGLGTKIETDPTFLENFTQLDVSLGDGGNVLAHPIEFVKPGNKEHPWQIDGITGATISSTAVATILSRSTAHWIPNIHSHLDDFREASRP